MFTGYGGLDMAVLAFYGGSLAWYAEVEPAACNVLAAHHPEVLNLGDVTRIDWTQVEPVDAITAGYPCQPFSHAGKRKGKNDERHLWPYVRDAIGALGPSHVVLENVAGHLSMGLADVIGDLAGLGMSARWGVVRAADAGAPHGRKRVFIVAQPSDTDRVARQAGSARLRGGGKVHEPRAIQRVERPDSDPVADARGERLQRPQPVGQLARERLGEHGQVAADADSAGSEARVNSRRHGAWLRDESVGPANITRDADSSNVASEPTGDQQESQPARDRSDGGSGSIDWGQYEPAIRRWERLTRPVPAPTVQHNGRHRLSPAFVEWMMGLSEGHVTGHGLSNAQALKMLGNGVVPQQAYLALGMLA